MRLVSSSRARGRRYIPYGTSLWMEVKKWTSLSLRNNLLFIAFITIAVTSLVASVGYRRVWVGLGNIETTMQGEVANERDNLVMESGLKLLVQEWNIVLLRGRDAEALSKHWSGLV